MAAEWDASTLLADEVPWEPNYSGPGVAVVDLDGDGWLEIASALALGETWLIENNQGELTPSDSVAIPNALGLSAGDFNNDGQTELILLQRDGEMDALWSIDGEQTTLPESEGHSITASVADANLDGWLDVFIARHHPEPIYDALVLDELVGTGNSLLLNTKGTLEELESAISEADVEALTFMGAWVDSDGDNDLDLYTANDFGMYVEPNQLLENTDGEAFNRVDDTGAQLSMAAMGIANGDFNGDGIADLYISDIGSPNLLTGDGENGFIDATYSMGAQIEVDDTYVLSWGVVATDLDADGWSDLFVAAGPINFWDDTIVNEFETEKGVIVSDIWYQEDVAFRGSDDGFDRWEGDFENNDIGRSVVTGDLDQDGRPELITVGWSDIEKPVLRVWKVQDACGNSATLTLPWTAVGAKIEALGRTTFFSPASTFSTSAPQVFIAMGNLDETTASVTLPNGEQATVELRAGEVSSL